MASQTDSGGFPGVGRCIAAVGGLWRRIVSGGFTSAHGNRCTDRSGEGYIDIGDGCAGGHAGCRTHVHANSNGDTSTHAESCSAANSHAGAIADPGTNPDARGAGSSGASCSLYGHRRAKLDGKIKLAERHAGRSMARRLRRRWTRNGAQVKPQSTERMSAAPW